MPGLNSSLNIGLSGLEVTQAALNVIGHNIANVNTPDYSRQVAVVTANRAQRFGNLEFGTGVSLSSITGVRDRFLNMQITQATAKKSGADTRYSGVEGISPVFEDDGKTGLGTLVQNFFNGLNRLAAQPEDGSVRTNLIGQTQSMVSGFQSRYQLLEDQRKQADGNIGSLVKEVNTLTAQIAELNNRIAAEPTSGADNDARDQRQTLANQLAGLVGVQVFEDNRGRMQIMLDSGAAVLVSGDTSYEMSATPDAALGGMARVEVSQGAGTPVDVTTHIKDGQLGANLDLRDNVLAGYEQKLDEIAAGIVGQVNLLHRNGFDLNGAAVAGTGWQDLFQGVVANGANGLPTTITAATSYKGMVNSMVVNAAIAANPNLIAASGAANSPGNNKNALALAALQTTNNTVDSNGDGIGDSGPYNTAIASLLNTVGTQAQSFQSSSTNQENLLSALQTQRDRVSGVDLDQEATNLITYQRGYQAAARFISVIDQLTDQLVNQFGR